MDRERWRRIEELYHAARSLPPEGRARFLASECGDDGSLRSEVESLLAQPDATWTGPGDIDEQVVGKRVGHYHVEHLLGAGGMGRVYRARDTKLGRSVALKLLPPEWTSDPDRLARLEREARLLASLNHPNIATIHGLEEADGLRALVLEFIEGDTLADRLARGRLPVAETLAIARQVKDALDTAHERGIVHRDLKPANIAITPAGLVKVLDFGLAVLEPSVGGGPHGSEAPTMAARGTREGIIAGTAAYMSPEQARGLAIDKRTDIWAFGCVLYEMLAGRAAFARATITDTLAAIVEREPDWSALPRETPDGVVGLLRRCLEKDRRTRLRDIGDAEAELRASAETSPRRAVWPLAVVAAAITIASTGPVAWSMLGREPAPQSHPGPIALTMLPPDEQRIVNAPIPSPDGTRLAFVATVPNGRPALWTRTLSDTTARRFDGTDGAENPFWSADGRYVAFAADGRLKKVDVGAGTVQAICECVTGALIGGTWNSANEIVFGPSNRTTLHRVHASGGTPAPVTALDPERNENSHRWPFFLPDGRRLLFTARSDVTANIGIYLLDLESGERRWLFAARSQAIYVPSGYILFVQERTLMAIRFDAAAGRVVGDATPVASAINHTPAGAVAAFAASANGEVLVHRGGTPPSRQLVQVDRQGTRRRLIGEEDRWGDARLSPDGKRIALVKDDVSGNRDIWLMELATGRVGRWSSHPATDWRPIWSPDGEEMVFASDRNGASAIFRRRVNSRDDDLLIAEAPGPTEGRFPDEWPSAERLLFHQDSPDGYVKVFVLAPSRVSNPTVFAPTTRISGGPRLSPDGRWIAYVSDESGPLDVYVASIDGTMKTRISTTGGTHPRWSRSGSELLYYAPTDNALMSIPVKIGASFEAGTPERLFQTCLATRPPVYQGGYELMGDGSMLWLCPGTQEEPGSVTVAVGWSAALASRAH